jgi:hypothetical protein
MLTSKWRNIGYELICTALPIFRIKYRKMQ